jgi:hypothetical protein
MSRVSDIYVRFFGGGSDGNMAYFTSIHHGVARRPFSLTPTCDVFSSSYMQYIGRKLRGRKIKIGRRDDIHERRIIRQVLIPLQCLRRTQRDIRLHGPGGDTDRSGASSVHYFVLLLPRWRYRAAASADT